MSGRAHKYGLGARIWRFVAASNEPVTARQVAEALGIDPLRAAARLSNLRDKGMIERCDPSGKRNVRALWRKATSQPKEQT